jgi:geranylgeranyl reductase family protein
MQQTDVIIAGGGPAGATAAYHLGRAGVRTLLLDRARFPRDKPCGGGLSSRLLERFPHVRAALGEIDVHAVHRVQIESPEGTTAIHRSRDPVYLMIRRIEFDDLLFRLARPHVSVREQALVTDLEVDATGVTVKLRGGETLQARLVIGADGANSIVSQKAGLRVMDREREFAIDMMEETPRERLRASDEDALYVCYGIQGHFGYGYVFPKTTCVNLGMGVKLDYYRAHFSGPHYEHHGRLVDDLRRKGVVEGESDRARFQAFPIPVAGPLPRTYGDRVLLCGDAGGFVNAFTAEGIFYAMVSGEHAAATAVEALANTDGSEAGLAGYERRWRAEIGLELEKSVEIQRRLFADPRRIDRLVRAAASNPALTDLLAGYATGRLPYRRFRRLALTRALPFYLREKARSILRGYSRAFQR